MRPKLYAYEVTYQGLFTGGVAIVLARDEAQAEELVKEHTTTHNFTEIEIAPLQIDLEGCVLWNWTGKADTGEVMPKRDDNRVPDLLDLSDLNFDAYHIDFVDRKAFRSAWYQGPHWTFWGFIGHRMVNASSATSIAHLLSVVRETVERDYAHDDA